MITGQRVQVSYTSEFSGRVVWQGRGRVVGFVLSSCSDGQFVNTVPRIVVECSDGRFRFCTTNEVSTIVQEVAA
ncbi:MAG TPA: hypothetical protein VII57_05980 [Dehalococcoidia bacterium]|nr:hypothetical protein [Dehalococcoidia bacterium]